MAARWFSWPLFLLSIHVHAQNISTTTPVPPLQWINLTNLLQGTSKPPPLKDAAIGYDEVSRTLIIFGGLSESGVPQSQTFLLNLHTLSWSIPSPPVGLQRSPPSRSAVVSGSDFAASNRHGFVVIGGRAAGDKALSDVWEYDFNNQFWSEVQLSPGGPSPRWDASGGIDPRIPPNQDPVVPGPNNTFYLAGGFDGKASSRLSDVWKLTMSGTLSSNLPDDVKASWDRINVGNISGRVDQSATVIGQQIITTGGCVSSSADSNTTCATQDSFIIDTQRQISTSPAFCPAPRVDPVLVPNLSGFSSAFASQAFLLLGVFNTSLWQDSNGLVRGEVAVLDTNTATWTRVLPSGDPDSSGKPRFPSPRRGAAAISFSQALVGDSRNSSADTIVFGGQDANGNYLSDVWLLRAYSGIITQSATTWSGFGNGGLQTGINADGSGVQVSYLNECASSLPTLAPNNSVPPSAPTATKAPFPVPGAPNGPQITRTYNVAFLHKLLMPLSLVLLIPITSFLRWWVAATPLEWPPTQHRILISVLACLCFIAYAIGFVGVVLAFTTISCTQNSPNTIHMQTGHGVAGLVFFVCVYVLVPFARLVFLYLKHEAAHGGQMATDQKNLNEKVVSEEHRSITPSDLHNGSPPGTPRARTLSWDTALKDRASNEGGLSNESSLPGTPHGFEVLNRPRRARTLSGHPPATTSVSRPSGTNLGDIDWLLRRRSLNTVGELDYVLTQVHNAQVGSPYSHEVDISTDQRHLTSGTFPDKRVVAIAIFTQISMLGVSAVTLAALWTRAPRYSFWIFLLGVLAFYAIMALMAWRGGLPNSILTISILRLRRPSHPTSSSTSITVAPRSPPTPGQGPYVHHRLSQRTAQQVDESIFSHTHNTELEDDDGEVDDDTRQRLMEEEMARRDVSIITVPRRKLQIANVS